MKKIIVFFVLVTLLIQVFPVSAQDYSFSLDAETVHVYWETDGTISLYYEFVFTCDPGAHPIDYVDVSMPNSSYNPSNATAKINGSTIHHITYSAYVTNAIELGLGNNAIQPGETGTVTFQITGIDKEIYYDSENDNYASGVFSPMWFDSSLVHGNTDMTVVFHLPPGVLPEEGKYHRAPAGFSDKPYTSLDSSNRVTYAWTNSNAQGDKQYLFGASFPLDILPAGTVRTPTIWERMGVYPEDVIGFLTICGVAFFIIGLPIISIVSQRRRKMKYLPPMISLGSHGIKRGLTAIEAAILLEEPMDKILTMVLFSVIKKNAAEVITNEPLELDVNDPLPEKLRKYEIDFLEAMRLKSKAKRKTALQKAMVSLVKSVQKKMKGFGKRDTVNYYKKVIEKAWQEVEQAGTPEVKSDTYNKYLEWTMLDKDYSKKTETAFIHHPIIVPHWWHRYDSGYRSTARAASSGARVIKTASAPAPRPTAGGAGLPQIPGSDFAASMVNGVQSFAAGTIGSLSDFTSRITNRTNPIPKSSSSSYRSSGRSGGGSSCACACACAGCACACAGGGR